MLSALESLPLIPAQQNYDGLSSFLDPLQTATLVDMASKARLTAKLQHDIQWVQQHVQAEEPISELCQSASSIARTAT